MIRLSVNGRFSKALFPEVAEKIEAYEIVGSYCPGTYDLSIERKEICWYFSTTFTKWHCCSNLFMYRRKRYKRAELIRDFYEVGLKGRKPNLLSNRCTECHGIYAGVNGYID